MFPQKMEKKKKEDIRELILAVNLHHDSGKSTPYMLTFTWIWL